jgi:nucleotide-sensitive chloride channel 1A
MTITLLSQAPNLSELKVHHTQKDSALLVSPPLAGQQGPIFGEMMVAEE